MKKNDVIPGRAYQVQSGDQVLPELIELIAGEAEIIYPTADDAPNLSDLYLMMKAQVDQLENTFESLQQMDEAAEWGEGGFTYLSGDHEDIQSFAEGYEGVPAGSDDFLYELFVESVSQEFAKRPQEYGKYALEEVCEAFKDRYVLHPDPKAGGWWKRVPGGTEAPVRASTVEDPWESEDGSDY
jgi:hypothetical protein